MVSTAGSERKTDRAEAFSDAVLAIAITLPVVELKAPTPGHGVTLADGYLALAPGYIAYALSFVVIGLYWAYSHFSGKLWRKTDHVFNLLTLVFLAAVSVTPFPSRPFVESLATGVDTPVAASVYAWMLAAPALCWTIRWFYGVRRGLLDPRLAESYVTAVGRNYAITTAACVAGAIVTTFASWRIGIGVVALCTLRYVLPPRTPRYQPGQEPRDDIEEADERPADAPGD